MRRVFLSIPLALATLSACRSPGATPASGEAVGQRAVADLPEPGVYVLQRVNGLTLPADLKPPDYDPRRGSNFFERVLDGRLYLTPDRDYQTVICADLVDSAGRASNQPTGLGGEGNKYWSAGGRVFFSDVLTDALPDSTAVKVRGDTVEFARQLFIRDRSRVLPHFPVIVEIVCRSLRASSAHGTSQTGSFPFIELPLSGRRDLVSDLAAGLSVRSCMMQTALGTATGLSTPEGF